MALSVNSSDLILGKSLNDNGSPPPLFETDDDRTYFLTVISVHPLAQVEAQVELSETHIHILRLCEKEILSTGDMVKKLGHETLSGNIKKSVRYLLEKDLIEYTVPGKPRSKLQKYRITDKGRGVLGDKAAGNGLS